MGLLGFIHKLLPYPLGPDSLMVALEEERREVLKATPIDPYLCFEKERAPEEYDAVFHTALRDKWDADLVELGEKLRNRFRDSVEDKIAELGRKSTKTQPATKRNHRRPNERGRLEQALYQAADQTRNAGVDENNPYFADCRNFRQRTAEQVYDLLRDDYHAAQSNYGLGQGDLESILPLNAFHSSTRTVEILHQDGSLATVRERNFRVKPDGTLRLSGESVTTQPLNQALLRQKQIK